MDPALAVILLVVVVGLFAIAPKPRWLDTLWLWLIGLSFIVYAPIWLFLKVQDFGAWNVGLGILAIFLAGAWYAWPTDDPAPPRRRPDSR